MSRYGTEPVELLLDNEDMVCEFFSEVFFLVGICTGVWLAGERKSETKINDCYLIDDDNSDYICQNKNTHKKDVTQNLKLICPKKKKK